MTLRSSVSPNKSNINTESHFLSTMQFRDLYMTPEYVINILVSYTLVCMLTLHGSGGREPDGSVESRLIGDSGMNAPWRGICSPSCSTAKSCKSSLSNNDRY